MSTTANPIASDWKAHITRLHEEYERELRQVRARAFRDKLADRKRDQQREVAVLNKWLTDLHTPRQAKGPVTAHDGYVFTVRWNRWYHTYSLVIGKPNSWLHNIDPERYGKIFWSDPIDHPGKVAEALATLETQHRNLEQAQARPAPQPSLEERDPRAMLTQTERDVIAYLEHLIKRIEQQKVLTDTQALVFAVAQFVNSVEVITLDED